MMKMSWYKMQGQEFMFQLLSLASREDFALWDNTARKFTRQVEGVQNINDIKFMKADLFMQRYPNLRKSTQYVRDIAVAEGSSFIQYQFGFKKTAEDQIGQFIANCNALKANPLAVLLKYRKIGIDINTQHSIIAMETIGVQAQIQPQTATIPQQAIQTPIPQQIIPNLSPIKLTGALQQGFEVPKQIPNIQPVVALNEQEQVVYGLACEHAGTLSRSDFVDGFVHTYKRLYNEGINGQRAMDIYDVLYSK